jgi:lysine-specific permease
MQGRDFTTLLTSYIGLWLFLLIWAGHKIITKSKAIDPLQADIKRYNY